MANATLLVDGKQIDVWVGKLVVTRDEGDGRKTAVVLNMTRADNAALVAALKETMPKA